MEMSDHLKAEVLDEEEDEHEDQVVVVEDIPIEQIEIIDSIELESEHVWEDRLIEEVRNYRLLWDRTRRDYGHQEKCSIIWALIAKSLGRSAAYCSGQWKNLRDSYVRRLKCVRRLAFHGLTPRKPSWRHFDSMSFLDEHVNHRGNQVDVENDQPLPNCSSKNVAFFDDGLVRAPNKNKLGGMGKKGPSHVRISSLPKEPVALFSRIGLGEITVVDDTADPGADSCGHFINQDGDDGHVVGDLRCGLEESPDGVITGTEYVTEGGDVLNPNVVHIIIEENEIKIDDGRIADSSEAVETVLLRNDVRHQENADTSEENLADHPEERQDRVSSTDDSKRRLRPGRKRSYRRLAAAEKDCRNAVVELDDDTTETNEAVDTKKSKRRETTSEQSDDFKELLRCGFANIDMSLNTFIEAQNDENSLFARSVAQVLDRLPQQVRAETKMKIMRILYEAELQSSARRGNEPRESLGDDNCSTLIATVHDSDCGTDSVVDSRTTDAVAGCHSNEGDDDDDDDDTTAI